jgi:hypothetical protein
MTLRKRNLIHLNEDEANQSLFILLKGLEILLQQQSLLELLLELITL